MFLGKKKSTSNLAKKVGGTDDMKLELWNDWIGNLVMINGLHCIHRFQCIMWWCLALATCYSCYKPKPQSGNGVRDFIFLSPLGDSVGCRRVVEERWSKRFPGLRGRPISGRLCWVRKCILDWRRREWRSSEATVAPLTTTTKSYLSGSWIRSWWSLAAREYP